MILLSFLKLLIFFVDVLGVCCREGFSLVAESGGYSPGALHGLLLLWSTGSRVLGLQ